MKIELTVTPPPGQGEAPFGEPAWREKPAVTNPIGLWVFRVSYPFKGERIGVVGNKIRPKLEDQGSFHLILRLLLRNKRQRR